MNKELTRIHSFGQGEECVGITQHDGYVVIVTTKGIYKLVDEKLEPIILHEAPADHLSTPQD